MSLRSRLIAAFVAIAVALIGADLVVAVLVRHSLVSAVDRRIEVPRAVRFPGISAFSSPAPAPAPSAAAIPAPSEAGEPALVPRAGISEFYVLFIDPSGIVVNRNPNTVGRNANPPKLPANIAARAAPQGTTPKAFTVPSEGGGYSYRVVAVHTSRGILVIAASLRDTVETVNKVLVVESIASVLVLLLMATVAWWVLHLGVRPLDRMARTAEAIADGDLSRRIDMSEHRTEVGRLGLALNRMLAEIEQSFRERQASEERLRRFIADASHELRTPLTSIRGYAELWRQGGLRSESELAEAMRRTEQEGARMGELVDDMLLLARLDEGRPLAMNTVDIESLTADAVADARAVEPDRPIELTAHGPLIVHGDEGRLRQVLGNMLANVRDHTPPGTPVRVTLGHADDRAFVEVEDDGPGLGPEPAKVFERFYRGDPARSRRRGGSGLGLSIVASIIEAHGGRASAGAAPSGGARLRVELPLATADRPAPTFA